jgi:hypothetical protein
MEDVLAPMRHGEWMYRAYDKVILRLRRLRDAAATGISLPQLSGAGLRGMPRRAAGPVRRVGALSVRSWGLFAAMR